MTRKKPIPSTYEPKATYGVELARAVRLDGLLLRGDVIVLTGAAVTRLVAQEGADILVAAEKV